MYPRTNYEMAEKDLKEFLDACEPMPSIITKGYTLPILQENANRIWQKLGKKMGFDAATIRPINGKGYRFFSAIPTEHIIREEHK